MSLPSLVQYRPSVDFSWHLRYLRKIGSDELYEYKDKVYSALKKLPKGHCYDIYKDVPEDMQELFIKCADMYMTQYDGELYFTDDFTKIYRNKL